MTSSKAGGQASVMASDLDNISRLERLVRTISEGCKSSSGFGTFTLACYDTAWVSMVTRESLGRHEMVFPECFSFLLREQHDSGGWGNTSVPIDSILNSLAGLLCLAKHRQQAVKVPLSSEELDKRIEQATSFLSSSLQLWDVENTVHVGFELLVPALLKYVAEYDIHFDFPQKDLLMRKNASKLAKFNSKMLYMGHTTTLVHSLEAFIGTIDFDRVKHHLRNGSMFGSPAATSAYLMHATTWDDWAEAYLKTVASSDGSNGGIPSAYPSSIFESTWALSTLLSNGVDLNTVKDNGGQEILDFLSDVLVAQNGVVGFSPGMLPDADDTAKTQQVLCQSQIQSVDPSAMIKEFTDSDNFRTYRLESSPSFSANCNVLLSLLAQPKASRYKVEIQKAVNFLMDAFDKGSVTDKWNLSPMYSLMLFVQALTTLVKRWDEGELEDLGKDVVIHKTLVAILEVARRVYTGQDSDGSWLHGVESTAYAVLALSQILRLPLQSSVRQDMTLAFNKGRDYLNRNRDLWRRPAAIWVEKVSYGSPILSESYCIAASICPYTPSPFANLGSLFELPEHLSVKLEGFARNIPSLKNLSTFETRLSIYQSHIYLQRLQDDLPAVFPQGKGRENKYLTIVPFTWVVSNVINGNNLSTRNLWDMMQFSVLIYQVDEYMESVVADLSSSCLNILEFTIREQCDCLNTWIRSKSQCDDDYTIPSFPSDVITPRSSLSSSSSSGHHRPGAPDLKAVTQIVQNFITHVMNRPTMLKVDDVLREYVLHELCNFLLAHIHHIRDNSAFNAQRTTAATKQNGGESDGIAIPCFSRPGITYHDWVRSVSADDTSCPFAFAYFCCLLSEGGSHPIPGGEARYLVQSACRHLAVMCRQYNDYGSLLRDVKEGNLNGLNFPEFSCENSVAAIGNTPSKTDAFPAVASAETQTSKRTMLRLAEYERRCLELSLSDLSALIKKPTYTSIRTFVDVTDLYGQIYVIKDLTNRVEK